MSFPATAEARTDVALPPPATKLIEPTGYFFTYGTLQRGQPRNSVLEHEVFIGEAYITDAQMFDTGYGFPAVILGREGMVWGEVYEITHPATWAMLDRIENGMYRRVARRVHIPGRAPLLRHPLAQLYEAEPGVFERTALVRINDGRWNATRT